MKYNRNILKHNRNRERKIKNLKKAGKKLDCQNLFIITKEKPNNFIKDKKMGVITKERFLVSFK